MLLHSGMTRQEIVCESKTVVFNIKCDSQVLDFLSFHYFIVSFVTNYHSCTIFNNPSNTSVKHESP